MNERGETYLRVWERTGDFVDVAADDEPSVDAAVSQWIVSGRTRDRLLHLTRRDGDTYTVCASVIVGWMLSTPEGRSRSIEIEKADADEQKAMRQAAGMWDDAA